MKPNPKPTLLSRMCLPAALLGSLALLAVACGNLTHPGTERQIGADFVTLDKAIRSYASSNGRHPKELGELVRPDTTGRVWLTDSARLTDPYGRPYAYEPSQGSKPHNLVSLGPDGKRDDSDLDLRTWRARRM